MFMFNNVKSRVTNQKRIHKEIKSVLNVENGSYQFISESFVFLSETWSLQIKTLGFLALRVTHNLVYFLRQ
jgi:hypothetical protein